MSCIVYHKGVLAADTRAYSGNNHPIGDKLKIHRITEGPFKGSLLGISTCQPGMAEEFKQWVTEGMRKEAYAPNEPSIEALLVKPNGEVFFFNDAYYASGPLVGDTFTIGSGRKYALGAIKFGANAQEAVRVAMGCDPFTGGTVTILTLQEAA